MSYISNILYIAGYTFDFENNIYTKPLKIEVGRHNTFIAQYRIPRSESLKHKVLTSLFRVLIYFLLTWSIPYLLYMSIRDNNVFTFGRSWFQLLIVAQYYSASSYFSNNHFYENIMCNKNLKKVVNISFPCVFTLSLMLSIMNVLLLNYGFRYIGYDEIYKNSNITSKVFMSILIFIESFYSYLIFTLNSCVFAINMLYHKTTVHNYYMSLGNYIKNSMNILRKINIIATEFAQMKSKFDNTVDLLTPFFSALNFIGVITMYFYLNALKINDLGVNEYINSILFIIIELIYICSIQTVNTNILNISLIISSNNLISIFFGNKQFNRNMPSIDKPINLYTSKKKIDIDIKRFNNDQDNNQDNNNEEKKDDTYLTSINSIMKNIMVSSISTEQMLEWNVLRNIVSSRWNTFRIFGVEFTDTTVIAKLFGLIVGILISSQLGSILKWW